MPDIYLSAETNLGLQQSSNVMGQYTDKDILSILLVIPDRNAIITMKNGQAFKLEADPETSSTEFMKTLLRGLADGFEQGVFSP